MVGSPLRITVQAVRTEVGAIKAPQLFYMLAALQPPATFARGRAPLNISLVIDRSTSMRGERLNRVREAAALVIENLAPEDVISIISFSDRAEVVVGARRVGNKTILVSQLNRILAAGGTEMYHGLFAGAQELYRLTTSDMISHLILLTDGRTYGDDDKCLSLARKLAEKGVGISAFGIGEDWNDTFLDSLVGNSGGHSAYIESPAQILSVLQSRVEGLGAVYAHNVRLQLTCPVGVELAYVFKVSPYAQPLPLSRKDIHLGAIEGESPLTSLFEIEIKPQLAGTRLEFDLSFQADIPSLDKKQVRVRQTFPIVVLAEPALTPPPPVVLQAVRLLSFYRLNEQAWEAAEEGQLELATRKMARLTARLENAGFTELASAAELEIRRMEQGETMSLSGRKRLKYGTRGLFSEDM